MDEKGFLLGQVHKVKVICQRDRGAPIHQVDSNREFVTVLETISAERRTISPCIIWKGKHHKAIADQTVKEL